MPDHKPPPLVGDERETLGTLLRYQRESLLRKVSGLDEAAARTPLVDSGTTLVWLVKHMARAELTWICHRFAGTRVPLPHDTVEPADTLAHVVELYRSTWPVTDAVIAAATSLDETCRTGEGVRVNLRWVLVNLLQETARHAGHADILRELLDGQTGR